MGGLFSAEKTIFESFMQDLLSMSINLLPALDLVFPKKICSTSLHVHFILGSEPPDTWESGGFSLSDEVCGPHGHG